MGIWSSFRELGRGAAVGAAVGPRIAAGCLLLALLPGCGPKRPEMGRVEGVVTFQGKPLAEAEVMFVPRQVGRPASGRTDQQGHFRLTTFEERDGALLGEHDVIVIKIAMGPVPAALKPPPGHAAEPSGPARLRHNPSQPPAPRRWLIPQRYGDVKTSGLSAAVKPGKNWFPFDLVP